MPRAEVDVAIEAAAREGWNPGLNDAECYYSIDPDGFFMGVLDGKPIARASALIYDDHFAFCGLYIVEPGYRGGGYGLKLTKARLEYVGDRNVGLDGVMDMAEKYARLGYKKAHISTRFRRTVGSEKERPDEVIPLTQIPFDRVLEYDRRHHFAPREKFLNCWISQDNAVALGFVDRDRIYGYGVIRRCREGFKIGPLFADQPDVARTLYDGLCNYALGESVILDVPEPNSAAMKIVNDYQMQPLFSCARMYMKGDPGLPLDNIYGITSFEIG